MWDWLAPGYRENSARALDNAAYVTYENLHKHRAFKLARDKPSSSSSSSSSTSASAVPRGEAQHRVGLWAKAWMTDVKYNYVGTLTTPAMFKSVVGRRVPGKESATDAEQKEAVESKAETTFLRLLKGPYAEQFSEGRLADARASYLRVGVAGGGAGKERS